MNFPVLSRFGRSLRIAGVCVAMGSAAAADFTADQLQFFETKIRPVLVENCTGCHGEKKRNNGLRLDSREAVIKGSDYGPVVEPGKPETAKLLKAIRHEAGVEAMPREGQKLSDAAVADLTSWVAMGLPWPAAGTASAPPPEKWRTHWAFVPVKAPAIPEPAALPQDAPAWLADPIDRLVLEKLHQSGLTPSGPAEKAVLIRRAFMALLGFPPSFDQVQQFLNDTAPDAWPRLVDALLASPHFGERQARRWMDTARYADTKGYVFQEERRYAYAYTYRDWLIRAFNADMPYDQFLIRQIAADKATDWQKQPADLAAMGFLTLGRRFLNNQNDIIDDRLDVIFRGTQALTVSCARCHDHKFDPIPTSDYYALFGVLSNSHEPENKPEIGPAQRTPELEAYEKGLAEREAKAESSRRERLEEVRRPEIMAKYRAAAAGAGDRRDKALREYARDQELNHLVLGKWIEWISGPGKTDPAGPAAEPPFLAAFKPADLEPGYTRKDREALKGLTSEIEKFKAASPAAPPRAMVLFDNDTCNEPVVYIRGNPGRPGPKVERRFLTALSPDKPVPLTEGSGRLQLAQAIASPQNPLTARVFVNRVWASLCGQGLVDTPGDFGVRTAPPVNPALLDYLAAAFVQEGWSVKKLMRRILLSQAWQQSSAGRSDMEAKDPDNRLFWRQNRQRLDFEALRDSLLAVSGNLDLTQFGQPVDIVEGPATGRRTIYGFIDRQNLPGLFRTFDFASPDNTAPRRYETTVPQQALYMLNNPFVIAQARRLIQDLQTTPDKDPAAGIAALYRRILQRLPTPEEASASLSALERLSREPRQTGTRWQNGFGYAGAQSKTVHFTPCAWFGKDRWSVSEQLPDPQAGWVMLNHQGGHPGDATHAAIRRWNVPEAGALRISGAVKLPAVVSGGVNALIMHSRHGVIWQSAVPGGGSVEPTIADVACEPGDTIDFILDSAGDPNSDSFQWAPVLTDAASGIVTASAAADFGGPGTSAWEACAQVLLCTNEFLFVD